jgi:indole-3-glycerol phosphate synthase
VGGDHRRVNPDLPLSRAILSAQEQGIVPVIADIKPVSPRDGDLLSHRAPAELARTLAGACACALSVVTEPRDFGGSCAMLAEVADAVSLPVLRKDFFSAPEQIAESHAANASAVLLIMATIPDPLASQLYQETRRLGMEAVVEIHTRRELDRALALDPTIIGINNRNILELETDLSDVRVTEELAPFVPDSITTISESSLNTPEEVRRARQAGVDAVLIGTAILQAPDIAARLKTFIDAEESHAV